MLRHRLNEDDPNPELGAYKFSGFPLTRGDIEWMIAQVESGQLPIVDLRGAYLAGGVIQGLPLDRAHLEGALLWYEHLEGARFWGTHLERAHLGGAHLEGAWLNYAHLHGTDLMGAHLENAILIDADLHDAGLLRARLERANLHSAKLQGADLREAHLEGSSLREAFLDAGTALHGAILGNGKDSFARLGNVHWSDANLTGVRWLGFTMTGEEWTLRQRHPSRDCGDFARAIQASRQLATVLRSAGLAEEADHFAYRAQVLVTWLYAAALFTPANLRRVWISVPVLRADRAISSLCAWTLGALRFKRARYFKSRARALRLKRIARAERESPASVAEWLGLLASFIGRLFMAQIAGYGYKAGRAILFYAGVIILFWVLYLFVGQRPGDRLSPLGALVLSVSSFHGRGFFPGLNTPNTSVALEDPRIVLAAVEAVIGLFVEVTFIATFTQRFWGR